ncbi:serine O-acetyltransferase [Desulfoluna butyratoxydans]|uniref:serine O-acetyltransferase n=1 Tax=Desulfoluna butyratoxydans TaxID=231438 RepID=UPI0015D24A2E|nr:hypothetical protein [Desulfoluna butyratoxydans]
MGDKFIIVCLWMRKIYGLRKISYLILKMIGVEIPLTVQIGRDVVLAHWATGLVIHGSTIIGNNVTIYQGVTIGRADVNRNRHRKIRIEIQDGAILCAGAKILCAGDELIVGQYSVVGANSVLLNSTEKRSVWAGIPATKISQA